MNQTEFDALPWIDIVDESAALVAKKYLPEAPVIIEAGACAADDTLRFKALWPNSVIHCFEPNPDLFKLASSNIEKGGKYGITIYPCALSDKIGDMTFYKSEFPGTSSFFKNNMDNIEYPDTVLKSIGVKSGKEMKVYGEEPITVRTITIDSLSLNADYLWLDTEGAELSALRGAEWTLGRLSAVSLELNHQQFRSGMAQFDEVYQFMIDHGFVVAAIWRAHKNWQSNAVFVKKELI